MIGFSYHNYSTIAKNLTFPTLLRAKFTFWIFLSHLMQNAGELPEFLITITVKRRNFQFPLYRGLIFSAFCLDFLITIREFLITIVDFIIAIAGFSYHNCWIFLSQLLDFLITIREFLITIDFANGASAHFVALLNKK